MTFLNIVLTNSNYVRFNDMSIRDFQVMRPTTNYISVMGLMVYNWRNDHVM